MYKQLETTREPATLLSGMLDLHRGREWQQTDAAPEIEPDTALQTELQQTDRPAESDTVFGPPFLDPTSSPGLLLEPIKGLETDSVFGALQLRRRSRSGH